MVPLQRQTRIPSSRIFTGNSNPQLVERIAALCQDNVGVADVSRFSDGEIHVEIKQHVRGKHAFVVQSICRPANDNLMELLVLVDALRRSDVTKITAVIPYYGYARQDRRPDHTRTPITSKLVATMIQAAGVDQVIVADIHSGQQAGFFDIPFINISAGPEIVADIWQNHYFSKQKFVVVSPDTGGVVRARIIAKQIDDADLAIIDKRRPRANESQVMNVIGDVEGRTCVMVDDMIDTAGTLCKASAALKDRGAAKVVAYATHGVFSGNAFDNLENSCIDEIVVSDTIPLGTCQPINAVVPDKIRVFSLADTIAETIVRITNNESVSEMYDGYQG